MFLSTFSARNNRFLSFWGRRNLFLLCFPRSQHLLMCKYTRSVRNHYRWRIINRVQCLLIVFIHDVHFNFSSSNSVLVVAGTLSHHRRERECRRHELLGGPGACTPGKFLKLDSLKRHFLRSLDWKWLTGKVLWGNKMISKKLNMWIDNYDNNQSAGACPFWTYLLKTDSSQEECGIIPDMTDKTWRIA